MRAWAKMELYPFEHSPPTLVPSANTHADALAARQARADGSSIGRDADDVIADMERILEEAEGEGPKNFTGAA